MGSRGGGQSQGREAELDWQGAAWWDRGGWAESGEGSRAGTTQHLSPAPSGSCQIEELLGLTLHSSSPFPQVSSCVKSQAPEKPASAANKTRAGKKQARRHPLPPALAVPGWGLVVREPLPGVAPVDGAVTSVYGLGA